MKELILRKNELIANRNQLLLVSPRILVARPDSTLSRWRKACYSMRDIHPLDGKPRRDCSERG
jgi:hypothetical protein